MPHLSKWEVSISTFSNACSQNTDEFIWPSPELWCYSDIWAPRWDPWNSLGPLLNCVAPEHHTNCHDKDLFFTLSCKSIVSNRTCRQIWKSLNKSPNEVKLLCSKHGSNHVSVGLERFILATLFQERVPCHTASHSGNVAQFVISPYNHSGARGSDRFSNDSWLSESRVKLLMWVRARLNISISLIQLNIPRICLPFPLTLGTCCYAIPKGKIQICWNTNNWNSLNRTWLYNITRSVVQIKSLASLLGERHIFFSNRKLVFL